MNKYIKTNTDGTIVEFEFVQSETLPPNIPISTPLAFCFAGQNLLLVKKQNDWWDIVGGKIEEGESYIDAIKREALEEAGVKIDNMSIVGYVVAVNKSEIKGTTKKTVLPVILSFINEVETEFMANAEVKSRDLVKRSEIKEYLGSRLDNDQLLQMYDYVIEYFDRQKYKYEFEYITNNFDQYSKLPITQSGVFLRNSKGNFYIVREFDSPKYFLPGGGCHLYESGEGCAIREVYEETQIKIESPVLIGIVVVKILNIQGMLISRSLHMRYFANTEKSSEFIADRKKGEIEERVEVKFDQLESNVEHLKNTNAPQILDSLKRHL